MAVIEIDENKNATLTKKNDEVAITKKDGDITINNSTNKGKDFLSFDENDYSKGSFSTAKSGRDLVLTYTEDDFAQNITIKNYFSKDGRSTSSSVYGYKLGNTETKLTDLYVNEINESSYKKNTINGTMFNDNIVGTNDFDKIYTGKGDDTITPNKGDDIIIINGSGHKTINISKNDGDKFIVGIDKATDVTINYTDSPSVSYIKTGNDLIIERSGYEIEGLDEEGEQKVSEDIYIKDFFKGNNSSKLTNSIPEYLISNNSNKLVGTKFNDLFLSITNNEVFYGLDGNNRYQFNIGNGSSYDVYFGNDTVYATGANDVLEFADNTKLEYIRKGNDLKITAYNNNDEELLAGTVTVKDVFKKDKSNVRIKIGNQEGKTLQEVLNATDILTYDKSDANKGQKIVGTYFNETFTGSNKADKIYTGAGNDTIKSGKGNDTIYINGDGKKTFEFNEGDGVNTITGYEKADSIELKFGNKQNNESETKITPTYTRIGNDLYVQAEYAEEDDSNEEAMKKDVYVKFTDFFKKTEDIQNKLVGWESNIDLDIIGKGKIYGDDKNNTIMGSLKADKIYTGAGDDTIIADKGNDIINITGDGNKEICISDGDGNDTIYGIFNSTKTNISFMKEGEDTSEPNKNVHFSKSGNDLIIIRKAEINGKEKYENTVIKDALTSENIEKITNGQLTINGEKIDFSDESRFIHVDIAKQKKNADGIYEGTETNDVIYDINKNTIIAGGKGDDEIQLGKKGHTDIFIGNGDGIDTISGVDFNERNSVSINFTDATEFDIAQNQNGGENYDYAINTGKGEGAIIDDVANINDNVELVASSEEDKTFDINGNISITSTSEKSNDTYNINYSSWEDIEINDEGGSDVINFTDSVAEKDLVGFFDVAKSSKYEKKLTSDLIITRKNDLDNFISDRELGMVAVSDYFDRDDYTINIKNGEDTTQIFKKDDNLDALKKDVVNFLKTTKYNTVSEAMMKGNKDIRQGLVDVFADGKNTYNIGHSSKTQTITDNVGDNDIYNVNNKFNFTKDKLIISDLQGDNDVLNVAQTADKLTILFDIKKSADEGESAVGDALYVIGKGQTNLNHGIQMDGIDTIKTSDGKGGYTEITTPTVEIISAVQDWLANANDGKGYDSVDEAFKANDADLANLIAKFAPSQQQA